MNLDDRLSLSRLRKLQARLEHAATLARNADNTAAGETRALALERDACAVGWALDLLTVEPPSEDAARQVA